MCVRVYFFLLFSAILRSPSGTACECWLDFDRYAELPMFGPHHVHSHVPSRRPFFSVSIVKVSSNETRAYSIQHTKTQTHLYRHMNVSLLCTQINSVRCEWCRQLLSVLFVFFFSTNERREKMPTLPPLTMNDDIGRQYN